MNMLKHGTTSIAFIVLGLGSLIAEYVRGYNAAVYADTHQTVGRFDLLDGTLIIAGLSLLIVGIALLSSNHRQKPRKIRERG